MAPKFHRFEEFAKKEGLKKGPAPPEPEDPPESRPSASGDAGDSFAGAGHQEEKPLRPMPSWMDLDEMEIDRNKYLIGEGFLEPGGYVVLVGASYAGKSTLCAQLSMSFAAGRSLFCFPVTRPLRSLIVQAEDLQNKLIRMAHMSRRMGFSTGELDLVRKNTAVLTLRDVQDKEAIREIERHALVFKPNVIWLNPLTSFLSQGVYKDDEINKFLRAYWTPMLDRVQCGGLPIHHPPKPPAPGKDNTNQTPYELQYTASGMAAITNNARGNVFLIHVNGDIFKLAIGKGFEELESQNGEVFIRRTKEDGIMLWEQCTPEEAQNAIEEHVERRERSKPGPKTTESIDIEKILSVLYSHDEQGGLSIKELQRFTDISKTTLWRRMNTLTGDKRGYLSPDGNYSLTPSYRRQRDEAAGKVSTKEPHLVVAK
jgi:hypothetical protein